MQFSFRVPLVSQVSLFGTQEFHRNYTGFSQESVHFHRKNAGTEKNSKVHTTSVGPF
jgi:hypothetical protein